MEHFYLRTFLLVFLILPCMQASALETKIDGIYYYFNETEKTAAVTYYYWNSAYSGSVTIPSSVTYNGVTYSVTTIGERAFYNCTGLTSITIPNSVTTIGENAFGYCTGLTKVIIPDIAAWCNISFGSLGANPLARAEHLYSDENTEITNLVIPNSVTNIGYAAFYHCTGLTSITIPNSVTSIGDYTFYNCTGLTSITIPNSVTSIGHDAFSYCI